MMLINSTWLKAFTGGIFEGECREIGFISLFFPLCQLWGRSAVGSEQILPGLLLGKKRWEGGAFDKSRATNQNPFYDSSFCDSKTGCTMEN